MDSRLKYNPDKYSSTTGAITGYPGPSNSKLALKSYPGPNLYKKGGFKKRKYTRSKYSRRKYNKRRSRRLRKRRRS